MGKPGAFLELGRKTHAERPCEKTVRDFDEFAVPLSESEQRHQASRCMMCGVAYCQAGIAFGPARTSGCPLHNLIPEWNDLVWRGLWNDAVQRLSLTNPFPEFTGRVCPALCEAACNLGLHEEPTSIRDDERAISDHAWASGSVEPLPHAPSGAPRVAVVGSGPAGLACAWELTRRGLQVTVLERSDRCGGLMMYGIPNMKLPKDVVERRLALMRESGIELRCGVDASDPKVVRFLKADYDAVVVAAGAGVARRLCVPGADARGVELAVDYLTSSTKSVLSGDAPAIDARDLDVVIIGGGDTGTDCVATALRQGARSVRQFEFMPCAPEGRAATNPWPEWPVVKKTDYGQREAAAVFGADPREWGVDTLEVLLDRDGSARGLHVVRLDWSQGKPERIEGSDEEVPAQLVLLAMGFTGPDAAVYQALGCEVAQVRDGVRPVVVAGHRVAPAAASADGGAAGDGAVGVGVPASVAGARAVFATGDARTGSSLVVNAIADGLACAAEVAEALAAHER